MAIAGRRPICIYCGETIPTISDKPFDGAIYPDWKGHNEICKHHPLNKQKMEQVTEKKNPILRCDEVLIKTRTVKIMSFNEFIEYAKEHYDEPHWSGNIFGRPFTHENDSLYLLINSDGSIVRFYNDEILVIDSVLDGVYFSTMTKNDFYTGRGAGWFDITIGRDYRKYNP